MVIVKRDQETGQYVLRDIEEGIKSTFKSQTAQIMADYVWENYKEERVQWLLL